MNIDRNALPNTIPACHARLQELAGELNAAHAVIETLQGENRALLEKVRDLAHRVFGRKSERSQDISADPETPGDPRGESPESAGDSITEEAIADDLEVGSVPNLGKSPKRNRGQQPGQPGHGRRRRPELPERVEYYDVPREQRRCSPCGADYVAAGTEEAEQVDWQVRVERVVIRRQRYRPGCTCPMAQPPTITAPSPPQLIPRGLLTVPFVVTMILMKYFWGMPLHRIVQMLAAQNCPLSPGTLVGVLRQVSPLLQPLYAAIQDRNRQEEQWHADETRWKVFADPAEKTGHNWWLWVFSGAVTTVFVLDPSRSSRVPREYLQLEKAPAGSLPRRLISDFYVVYRLLGEGILNAWCWAHIRRKFVEAGRSVPDLRSWSFTWVARIAELYHRYNQRKAARPDCQAWDRADQALRTWVAHLQDRWQKELRNPGFAPRALKVLRTVQRQWDGLTLFLDDPRIPLDNNAGERILRNPVTQRKNYYGSRAIWSGELAAQCWTIGATVAQNGINPPAFLTAYLTACAENGGQPLKADAWGRFLPWALSETDRAAWATRPSSTGSRSP